MRRYKLVLAIALIFTVVGLAIGTSVRAQVLSVQPVTPRVLAGADVGFRVEGLRGNTPIGTVVVKVNGEWVAAEIGHIGGVRPGTK